MRSLSVLGFVLMVGGLAGLFVIRALFSPSPIVIAFQAVAVVLMVWARFTFGRRSFHATANPTEGGLVTDGPYRWIRHPIYSAVALFAFAGALAGPSVPSIALAATVLLGAVIRIVAEERLLRSRYPAYAEYAARTKRMLPFVF
jgi:protein-S-isoprenylcysteine O-methyltransferase Ste14